MQLMSEEKGYRVYLGNDNETWYEVRAELRVQALTIGLEAYDNEVIRERTEKAAAAHLHAWFAAIGDDLGYEAFGDVEITWRDTETSWSPDLIDEGGRPVPEFETFWMKTCIAERGYWPVPSDPDPASEEPHPRASDFRGDWKA